MIFGFYKIDKYNWGIKKLIGKWEYTIIGSLY